jgi:hypothetical protein
MFADEPETGLRDLPRNIYPWLHAASFRNLRFHLLLLFTIQEKIATGIFAGNEKSVDFI